MHQITFLVDTSTVIGGKCREKNDFWELYRQEVSLFLKNIIMIVKY